MIILVCGDSAHHLQRWHPSWPPCKRMVGWYSQSQHYFMLWRQKVRFGRNIYCRVDFSIILTALWWSYNFPRYISHFIYLKLCTKYIQQILVIDERQQSPTKVAALDERRKQAWLSRQEDLNRSALAQKMVQEATKKNDNDTATTVADEESVSWQIALPKKKNSGTAKQRTNGMERMGYNAMNPSSGVSRGYRPAKRATRRGWG